MYDYSYNIQRCLTICNNIHMNDNLLLTTITLSIGNICNIGNADQYFMLTKWTYFDRVRAPFHESNIRLYKTKIMTKNKTS